MCWRCVLKIRFEEDQMLAKINFWKILVFLEMQWITNFFALNRWQKCQLKIDKNGSNSTCELEIIERICSSISGFFIKKVCNVFLSECRLRPFLSEENFLKTVEKNSCSGVKLYPTSGSDIFSPRSVPGQYFKTWTLNWKEDVVTVVPKKGWVAF